MLEACSAIAKGEHGYQTIIVDTIDNAYGLCAKHVCQKAQKEHESDFGYGKGYAMVNNEFQRVINRLAFLPYGLILVSHSTQKEVDDPTGSYTKSVPTLPDRARKIVIGLVDMILYCDLDKSVDESGKVTYQRVIRTKPNQGYEAGDRTGRLPATLPLDYAEFKKAYSAGKQAKVATG